MTVYQITVKNGDKVTPLPEHVYVTFAGAAQVAGRLYESTNSEFSKMKGENCLIYDVISLNVKE